MIILLIFSSNQRHGFEKSYTMDDYPNPSRSDLLTGKLTIELENRIQLV